MLAGAWGSSYQNSSAFATYEVGWHSHEKGLKVLGKSQQSIISLLFLFRKIELGLVTSFSRPSAPKCFFGLFYNLSSQAWSGMCTHWAHGVQRRGRWRREARHPAPVSGFRVWVPPSLPSLSRPMISHCFGCSSRRHAASCLFPPEPGASQEPSRYQEIIALGA